MRGDDLGVSQIRFKGLGFRGLGFGGFPKFEVPTLMENQMEKNMENVMETAIM